MNEITPSYYAAGVLNTGFVVKGQHFTQIPLDAVGKVAVDNSRPLAYRSYKEDYWTYRIVSKNDSEMVLESLAPTNNHDENYLGCICSSDGSIIYWTNNFRPLP